MENPGNKFYPIELVKTLGANRKAPVRVGDKVPKWEKGDRPSKTTTKVVAIYNDLLNNEVWLTQFRVKHALKAKETEIRKRKLLKFYEFAIKHTKEILKNPHIVLYDKLGAYLYGIEKDQKWLFVVVDEKTLQILTYIVRNSLPSNLKRFKILYRKK